MTDETRNYRVTYFVPGEGILHFWTNSYWKPCLFRLAHFPGWVVDGLETREEIKSTYERPYFPDNDLTDGRF